MKKTFLLLTFIFSLTITAQHNRRDGNRIGISAGITQTSLNTSSFNTKPEPGWMAGMAVRGNDYNDSSMMFGMQLFENNVAFFKGCGS